VTFYEAPNSNVVSGVYGIPSFDGQANLNNQFWSRYWVGILRNKLGPLVTRIGWQRKYWNGKAYDADKHVRFSLLAAANVRYALSPLPLLSHDLRLIHQPAADASWRSHPSMFPDIWAYLAHRFKVIFYGGDNYVYEINGALPRIYAAQETYVVSDNLDDVSFLERVIDAASQYAAVVRESDAKILGGAANAAMVVEQFEILSDGYAVTVESPGGGILMINNMYWPWWTASADGRDLAMVPANGVQMAVNVPKDVTEIKIIYHRPTMAARVSELLGTSSTN